MVMLFTSAGIYNQILLLPQKCCLSNNSAVHLCSMSGHRLVGYDIAVYTATKFAVTAILEGHRQELKHMKSNIRVTVST